jgi:hypothetical protein
MSNTLNIHENVSWTRLVNILRVLFYIVLGSLCSMMLL